jgi:hypothetical protein
MDWWDNSQKEIDRIISKIKDLQNGIKSQIEEQHETVQAKTPEVLSANMHFNEPVSIKTNDNLTVYKATKLNNRYVSADKFISGWHRTEIVQSVQLVMLSEAPISRGLLTRRVVQSFGIARSGNRIQEYMDSIYATLKLNFTMQNGEKIYWNNGQATENYKLIRATGDGDNKRDTKDVPITEAINAICYVLEQQISLSEEDLIREAAKLMGYTRMGNIVVALFEGAIKQANKQSKIKLGSNGKWIL